MENKFKFRLVFFHSRPGFFYLEQESITYSLDEKLSIQVTPRDFNRLKDATKYHIECGGFCSYQKAKDCGEKLRTHLRLINCMLDLGLSIPSIDGTNTNVSEEIKNKVRQDGGELLDTIVGLHVYPDDGRHLEHVVSGKVNVFPSDSYYVLKGLKDSWESSFELNESVAEILEILNISVRETSPKIKFLATYLAMEQIIEKEMRSQDAQELIDQLIQATYASPLSDTEKESLVGSLGYLKEQSFSSAFTSFARRITSPESIHGMSVKKFVSKCIKLRNKIAHNVAISEMSDIEEYTKHLRNLAMSILWSKNEFPSFSVYRPADQLEIEKMEIRRL